MKGVISLSVPGEGTVTPGRAAAPVSRVVDWNTPPDGFDDIVADLHALRAAAGEPSFAAISRRVASLRASRGVPEAEQRIPRSTLYDFFRSGRRRLDADVVTEVAISLGLPDSDREHWIARLRQARTAENGAAVAVVRPEAPAPVAHFTGREAELAALDRVMADRGRAWISGMPGSGKTQLALWAVRHAMNSEESAVPVASASTALFLDLRGHRAESPPVEPASAQRAILRSLGADETGSDAERARRLSRMLANSGRTLVLDDASGAAQVAAILGDAEGAPVIVTSRSPARELTGWTYVPVGGFTAAETAELVRNLAARAAGEHSSGNAADHAPSPRHPDPDELLAAAGRLAEATGGLPLAISLVAARLATHPEWTLAEHVDRLERRTASARLDEELRAELDLSMAGLPPDAARLLRAFADLPVAELGVEEAAALLEVSAERAAAAVAGLTGASLAADRGDRIVLHALVRAYARERGEDTDPPRVRDAAFARIGSFLADRVWAAYATVARSMEDEPRPTRFEYPELSWSPEEAGTWLRRNLSALLALAYAAPSRRCPQLLFRLSDGLSWWMHLSGHYADALRLHETAADVAADVGDADALATASLDAGQLLLWSERPEEAQEHFGRALRLADDTAWLADPGMIGMIRNMAALIDVRFGRCAEACVKLRSAAELHTELGEGRRLVSALTNLGLALHTMGEFAEEREVIDRGMALAEELGHDFLLSLLLVNSAELSVETGRLGEAVRDATRAVELGEEASSPYVVACGRAALAEAKRRAGDLDGAAKHAARALESARTLGAEMVLCEVLLAVAAVTADRGDTARTVAHLDEAEPLLAAESDHVLRGKLWRLRGELAEDPAERERWFNDALAEFKRAGSFHAEALRARR